MESKEAEANSNNNEKNPALFLNKDAQDTSLNNKDVLHVDNEDKVEEEDPEFKDDQNEIYWGSWAEFLLSCVGYAVGYSNALRFPYICYKHGGGAFLIPYFISVIFFGLPTLYMELALGQYFRMGPSTMWKHVSPMFKGLGIAMVISCVWDVIYFHIIIAWCMFYFYSSFSHTLPFASCNQTWNTPECYIPGDTAGNASGLTASLEFLDLEALRIDPSGKLVYDIVPHLAICLLLAWTVTYFAMCMGVESSGKVVYFTATAPYVMLISLLVRAVTLPGSTQGILYFLVPEFKKLGHLEAWSDALGQILAAVGIGFGAMITLGSYNRHDNKVGRDTLYIFGIGCCTSLIAGFVCFGVIGYMAHITQKPLESLINEGIVLAFVAYPEAIAKLPSPHFWAISFFFMLILLGMDSIYGMVETIITAMVRLSKGRWERKKPLVMLAIAVSLFLAGLLFATRAGLFWVTVMDTYIVGPIVLGLTLFEVFAVALAYGADRLADNIEEMTGSRPNRFWVYSWRFVCPLGVLFLFVVALANPHPLIYLGKPAEPWAIGAGIAVTLSVLLWIPVYAIIQTYYAKGDTWKEKLSNSFYPPPPKKQKSGTLRNNIPISTGPATKVFFYESTV